MAGKWKAPRGSWLRAGVVVAAAVLAVGCTETGDQGADGAAGPRGETGARGPAGETGPRGEQGERGETGAPGQRGSTSMIGTSTDVPAERCPNGGIRIETGLDANGNGMLDGWEVDPHVTRFVCNGVQGQQGLQGEQGATGDRGEQGAQGLRGEDGLATVFRTGAAGDACAAGGVRIQAGLDLNRNGILDDAEVNDALAQLVCNGAQGAQGVQGLQGERGLTGERGAQGLQGEGGLATVFRTTPESAGVRCAAGGIRYEAGLDANRNGLLDDGEVNAVLTRYVCDGVQGAQGLQGERGLTGAQGLQGLRGEQGLQGRDGFATVFRTTAEPAGPNCATGGSRVDAGLDVNRDGFLDAEEVNPSLTRFLCNGAQGIQGIQGIQGEQGLTGATGAQGEKGDRGDTGEQGIQGIQGEQGLTGATGAQGEKGDKGDTGEQGIQGIQGEQGLTGATGAQGEKGDRGDDGFATVFRTTRDDTLCTTGGLRIEAGLDLNRNRTLDEGEEDAALTRWVCDGEQGLRGETGGAGEQGDQGDRGLAGSNALVHTFWEPSSPTCSYGGIRVVFGTDYDGDGVLEGSFEIAGEEHVCNGATGATGSQGEKGDRGDTGAEGLATLVRTTALGALCDGVGGIHIEFGLDADRDGILGDGEVNGAMTQIVCNGARGPAGHDGSSGGHGLYGDGSAGPLVVVGPLDLTTPAGLASLPDGPNLNFESITVLAGSTLIVPSGTVLRAATFFDNFGTIDVRPGAAGGYTPGQGIASRPASAEGGLGLGQLQAARLGMPRFGGGGGAHVGGTGQRGDGGGSLIVLAPAIRNLGYIYALGSPGLDNTWGPGGGGGGGVVILAGTELEHTGGIYAAGGNGGHGVQAAGGGGGGGLIHLLGSSISVSGQLRVDGGPPGSGGAVNGYSGNGGGGSIGNGGTGSMAGALAEPGSAGLVLQTPTVAPERILLQ